MLSVNSMAMNCPLEVWSYTKLGSYRSFQHLSITHASFCCPYGNDGVENAGANAVDGPRWVMFSQVLLDQCECP